MQSFSDFRRIQILPRYPPQTPSQALQHLTLICLWQQPRSEPTRRDHRKRHPPWTGTKGKKSLAACEEQGIDADPMAVPQKISCEVNTLQSCFTRSCLPLLWGDCQPVGADLSLLACESVHRYPKFDGIGAYVGLYSNNAPSRRTRNRGLCFRD